MGKVYFLIYGYSTSPLTKIGNFMSKKVICINFNIAIDFVQMAQPSYLRRLYNMSKIHK
jgi:hypothetical protein